MTFIFQGKTPRQLAKIPLDPKRNGGKAKEQLIIHNSSNLVVGGWYHGKVHAAPLTSYVQYDHLYKIWIDKKLFFYDNEKIGT
jgi:hypothetical protein